MFVRSLVTEYDVKEGNLYKVTQEYDNGTVDIVDDKKETYVLFEDEYEIINESAPALQSAVKKPSTFELGQLVKILHSDYGDTVKAGQLRRVTGVFDHGIEITVFASDFNSDVQLFFTFDEVE